MRKLGIVAIAFLIYSITPTISEEFQINKEDYGALPPELQQEFRDQLQEIGVLGADDSLIYTGPEAPPEQNFNPALLAAALPLLCKIVVSTRNENNVAKCAKKKNAASAQACRDRVAATTTALTEACGLVTLVGVSE